MTYQGESRMGTDVFAEDGSKPVTLHKGQRITIGDGHVYVVADDPATYAVSDRDHLVGLEMQEGRGWQAVGYAYCPYTTMTVPEYLMMVWSCEAVRDLCPIAAAYTLGNARGHPNDADRAEIMDRDLDIQVWEQFAQAHGLPVDMTHKEYYASDFFVGRMEAYRKAAKR